MEPQQQTTQQVQQQNEEGNSGKGGGGGGSYMCRQSSTRWTPTTDQIRILKELYYNNGVRSPSAEQIQRISARLRQYGKIEGKNVFYWFQNHKARERQKKRFISDTHHSPPSFQRSAPSAAAWKPEDPTTAALYHNKFPNITTPGVATACSSSSSSQGVFAVGQMGGFGSYGGVGSVTMEKSFRDCSLSAAAAAAAGGNGIISQNFGWVGGDPYASPYTSSIYNDKRSNFIMETLEEDDDDDDDEAPEIETLPLFPIHNEDVNGRFCNMKPSPDGYYSTGWYRSDDGYGPSRTSLELSLSYSGRSHEST